MVPVAFALAFLLLSRSSVGLDSKSLRSVATSAGMLLQVVVVCSTDGAIPSSESVGEAKVR